MGYSVKTVSYYFIEQNQQVQNNTNKTYIYACYLYVACYIVLNAE